MNSFSNISQVTFNRAREFPLYFLLHFSSGENLISIQLAAWGKKKKKHAEVSVEILVRIVERSYLQFKLNTSFLVVFKIAIKILLAKTKEISY